MCVVSVLEMKYPLQTYVNITGFGFTQIKQKFYLTFATVVLNNAAK